MSLATDRQESRIERASQDSVGTRSWHRHVVRILFLSVFAFVFALALAPPPAAATSVSYGVDEGTCLTVTVWGTPPGSAWSITGSSPFVGVVSGPVDGIYYGPTMGTSHSGTTAGTYDNFYSACNVCPVGTLSASFSVPGSMPSSSTLGYPNPQVIPASNVIDASQYQSQCGLLGGAMFGDLDVMSAEMSPYVGPALIIGSILIIVVVSVPVHPLPAPVAPVPAPAVGAPSLVPSSVVTQGSYMAETAPQSVLEVPAGPPDLGQPVGGAGITVGPPDVKPPPTPPPNADQHLPPRCPRCGTPTVPAYGRWYCPTEAWYPWG